MMATAIASAISPPNKSKLTPPLQALSLLQDSTDPHLPMLKTVHHLLLVDDDEDIFLLLEAAFQDKGIVAHYASNALEALQHLQAHPIDLILLDVQMPGVDGFGLHEKIAQIERLRDIPVVFLTSQTNQERILEAYERGAEDYLFKPFHPEVIAVKLKNIIQRNKTLRSAQSDQLLPGAILERRYEIIREIGRGGMGYVYLVRNLKNDQYRALKVFYTRGASEEHRQRFQEEINALALLSHPNLIRLYGAGLQEHFLYYVMDYLPNGSLYERLQRGRLAEIEALHMCAAIADGLAHAHQHGIFHRDIKSENILFAEDGRPVLTDFGVALNQRSDNERLTKTGFVVGTIPYLSPEQVLGIDEADHRADIFSLGILFYEMLTGAHPFPGRSSHDVMTAILQQKPRPLREIQPNLSPYSEQICLFALKKNRDERFQDAAAFAEACRRVIAYLSNLSPQS